MVSLSSISPVHVILHSRRAIRAKVWLSRQLSTLFDVKNYATDMEDLMFRMWARKETNFPLSHIKAKKKTEEQRRLQQQRQRQHFRSVGSPKVLHRMVYTLFVRSSFVKYDIFLI